VGGAGGAVDLFEQGLAEYRSGRYFEAHERWEEIWRDEKDPVRRNFVQGLIQIAAAMHKLLRMGSATGALRLLERGHDRLSVAPPGSGGLDLPRLLEDIARARTEIARLAAVGRTDLAAAFVPAIEVEAEA
jgi:uncharacterized protein